MARNPKYTKTMGAFAFTANTKAEMADKIETRLRELASGTWQPTLVCDVDGNPCALVYRTDGGWNYGLLNDGLGCAVSTSQSRDETIARAQVHVAQATYDPASGDSTAEIIADPTDREQHLHWERWQWYHRIGRVQFNMTDAEARAYADKHTSGVPA